MKKKFFKHAIILPYPLFFDKYYLQIILRVLFCALREEKMGSRVSHGSYVWPSRYEIVQHEYVCTDCEAPIQGFAEVLEVRDPPSRRKGSIIHIFWEGKGYTYFEFDRLADAINAYRVTKNIFVAQGMERVIGAISKQPGHVHSSSTRQMPWFYETEK